MNNTGIAVKVKRKSSEINIDGMIGHPEWEQMNPSESGTVTFQSVKKAIDEIRIVGSDSVTVNIRSLGGNVNEALLIYEALKELECPVTTRCYGYVASAATIVAQAASPGLRCIAESSLYLIHRSVTEVHGNQNEVNRTAEMLEKTDERIAGIYADNSGKDALEFLRMMNLENGCGRWLTPQEVIQAGLADRVFSLSRRETRKIMNRIDTRALPYPCLPPLHIKHTGGLLGRLFSHSKNEPARDTDNSGKKTEIPVQAVFTEKESILEEELRHNALPTLLLPVEDPYIYNHDLHPNLLSYQEDANLLSDDI